MSHPPIGGLDQHVVAAPDDGSLGPLLRIADDRLEPGAGYGGHHHEAVDVVAVVVSGELRHHWHAGVLLHAGDVAVLRAGTGLDHDEVAGAGGARVLQSYLRAHDPVAPPTHEVHAGAAGWVDLGRPDARLWVARAPAAHLTVPAGLRVVVTADGAVAAVAPGGPGGPAGPLGRDAVRAVLVWALDTARPAWAAD